MKSTGLSFFLFLNLIVTGNTFCQLLNCKKSSVTIKRYQINNVSLLQIDSFLSKSEPFKVEVDSFYNNKKISTSLLNGDRITGYKYYTYSTKGNLLKSVVGMPNNDFKNDSTIYAYDHLGRIRSITTSNAFDKADVYSVRYKYKNGKTYLTDYINGKPAVTTVFWRNKKKNYQYSKVLGGKADFDYYLKKYDIYGNVISEETCLNNKCTVALSYILKYNECGYLITELLVSSDNKIFSAVTYDIK